MRADLAENFQSLQGYLKEFIDEGERLFYIDLLHIHVYTVRVYTQILKLSSPFKKIKRKHT